jgi:hypothetical protein
MRIDVLSSTKRDLLDFCVVAFVLYNQYYY